MRILHFAHHGEPWDVIELRDEPAPQAPEAGCVLVELEAAPIHIADLKAIRGDLPTVAKGDRVGGFEGVGRIIACGEDTQGWREGDRVIMPEGYGAWREVRQLPASTLWRAPEDVAAEQLALVRINMSTAYTLLHAYVTVPPGSWIIQNAANSNVGRYLQMFATKCGVGVINVVRRGELVHDLQNAGHEHILVDGPDLPARIADQWPCAPRLAIDAVGGGATERLGRIVANGGLVLTYGCASGEAFRIDYSDMMFRDVRLRGMLTPRAVERLGPRGEAAMREEILDTIASGILCADIAGVYGFDQAATALRHAAATGTDRQGKVILKPSVD